MKAYEYCKNAATTMEQRGKENGYDNAKEERSAKQIADVFNALTGRDLTEQEAWTFLICLKLVRQHRKHQEDNIVDLVAYAALLGESYNDEIQVDTTAAQVASLSGEVEAMVVCIGEDGSKICMTPEDFRNMEKTLVTGALK